MNISTRQLRAFQLIAKFGSFTKAAAALHLTQSGLSAMVHSLEDQFATRLLDRTTRSVSLTRAGVALLPYVERALNELAEGQNLLTKVITDSKKQLIIAASPMVASSLMPSVCAAYNEESTGVTVLIRDAAGPLTQELVLSGEVDAGFGVFTSISPGISATLQYMFGYICVFQKGTIQTTHIPGRALGVVTWSQLKDFPLLTLTRPDITQRAIASHMDAVGHSHTKRRHYDSLHTMVSMAAEGYGVAVVPSFSLVASQRYGAECAKMIEPESEIEWFCVTKSGGKHSEALESFKKTLNQVTARVCQT